MLVVDTASRFCSACVYDPAAESVFARRELEIGRGHAERLPEVIDDVLEQAGIGLAQTSAIAVTIGPGSFTGIRVGVAAARGFGLALGLPVTGVTTLESLAVQAHGKASLPGPFAVAIKGGRGQIFIQSFTANADPLADPKAVADDDAAGEIGPDCNCLAGDAAPMLNARLANPLPAVADRPVGTIEAVARAALRFAHEPVPLYLRGADAKPQQGFALPLAGVDGAVR